MMRILSVFGVLLALSSPCLAQSQLPTSLPPGSTIPKGLPPIPPNASSMTPAQAKAQYDQLDPASQQALKQAAQQAKAQYGNDTGMITQLKAMVKSWMGK